MDPVPGPSQERFVDVMGTTAHIIVNGGAPDLAERGVARLDHLEALWSRFRPDSEVSRLNERAGQPTLVSPETFTLVERARAGWRLTDGRFDPTLLPELQAAGYDRSFELLEPVPKDADGVATPAARPRDEQRRPARGTVESIWLDPVVGSVCLGPGVAFDPGGIGKGLAADMVVDLLLADGARGALVNVGGDLRAEGEAPEGAGWVVSVADANEPDRASHWLGFDRGAVASSWRTKRTWVSGGAVRHHLIDPRTGTSADGAVTGVTVISASGWEAEVLAKAVLLDDGEHDSWLRANHAAGIVFYADGTVRELADLARYAVPSPGPA
jgi:thiamine biosynthesis lipoprotein